MKLNTVLMWTSRYLDQYTIINDMHMNQQLGVRAGVWVRARVELRGRDQG